MANNVKLYDENGNHKVTVPSPSDYYNQVKKYNESGLFVKRQFNKAMTKVMTSYVGHNLVTTEQFNDPFNKIK